MRLSLAQRGYLAGLIDGEGSVESQMERQVRGATPRFVLRVSFVFATEEPVRTVALWLGLSEKRYPSRNIRHADRWRLHIPKSISVEVLRACLPFFILKRRQAELVLAIEAIRIRATPSRAHPGLAHFSRMPDDAVRQMAALHEELRRLKSNKRRR